ncbi:MAG TPA: response regulator transcription factor [Thermomicrobiales bacterium]|nr:response regulator transcription factor [Thermomicrobiales bacterium]
MIQLPLAGSHVILPLDHDGRGSGTSVRAIRPGAREARISVESARERPLVLVVEDDTDIQHLIVRRLRESDADSITSTTAGEAFALAGARFPDLVMVDLNLPDGSGIGLVKQLRSAMSVPIIVVTADTNERSLIECLDAGADDYVTKPFRVNELMARVRSALRRRSRAPEPDRIVVGSITIDLDEGRVTRFGADVRLTPTEYRLLVQLARFPNRVFTHGMILSAVWGPEYASEPHVLRVTLNRMRAKLGDPQVIENRPAIGYTLTPDVVDSDTIGET